MVNPQQKHKLENLWSKNFQMVKIDYGNIKMVRKKCDSENSSKYDLANMLMLVGAKFGLTVFPCTFLYGAFL